MHHEHVTEAEYAAALPVDDEPLTPAEVVELDAGLRAALAGDLATPEELAAVLDQP